MGTRKKGSELVFNLQWRNKADNGGDKSNVIGMYDTPTTTSNFEMFKSYLLKNSGVAGNDVKVTYLTDNGQEWVIDSQESFELALSAFRLKARLGEVILLKLDKISSGKHKMLRKHSNDVETQSEVDSMGNNVVEPPEWFITYMKQFKRDIVEEVTDAVSSNMAANSKEKEKESVPIVVKKFKPEITKRSRKHLVLGENPIDKELLKTLKFDRKLENKLDKLDAKTKKIKEKKQALINKIECDEYRYFGGKPVTVVTVKAENAFAPKKAAAPSEIPVDDDGTPLLNGCCVNLRTYEHMLGGEVYLKTWKIANTGKQRWSSKTELRLTWGSADLVPSVKSVRCPCLKPGEQGNVSVNFEVPKKPGTYESYWNFYHDNVRFGNSVTCFIIVDKPLTPSLTACYPHVKIGAPTIIKHNVEDFFEKNKTPVTYVTPSELNNFGYKMDTEVLDILDEVDKSGITQFTQTKLPENSPPIGSENILTEEEKPPKIFIYPEGVEDTSKAFTITVPADTERVIWYPPGFNNETLKPIEIPVKQVVEGEKKSSPKSSEATTHSVRIFPSSSAAGEKLDDSNCFTIIHPPSEVNEKSNDLNNGNVSSALPSDQSKQSVDVKDISISHNDLVFVENVPTYAVMDLSKRIGNIKLAEQDSDSDWGSVCSFEKEMQMEPDLTTDSVSNKYGILEKDLIVDLSTNGKDGEKEQNEEKMNVVTSEDNNNNNGAVENNNCSRESISEAESEASSVSSGYDVLQVPVCEEKEDSSGYVYITIDGNKLPVPKHILRPDFLANAEEAPGPISTDDERPVEKPADSKENIPEQANVTEKAESPVADVKPEVGEQPIQDNKPPMTLPSEASTNSSTGRLFIFPQNQPGYEVFGNTSTHSSLNRVDSFEPYTWSRSPTQYNLSDPANVEGVNPVNLRSDPYGPLDNASAPFAEYHQNQAPEQSAQSACPFASYGGNHYYQHCRASTQFAHVPNYQQCGQRYHESCQSPSAPPQQQPEPPKSPEQPQGASAPVHHILPENLVNGAVNVASSAINTARSVINMLSSPKPEAGRWVNGHWVTENPESLRAKNLVILAEMGFWDMDLNATLLARYNDDIARVITELVQ